MNDSANPKPIITLEREREQREREREQRERERDSCLVGGEEAVLASTLT